MAAPSPPTTLHHPVTTSHKPNWDLVTLAQTGDRDAFANLYKHYVDTVFRYILTRIRHRPTTEDLTSETFTRALHRINTITNQGHDVGAWLITIARNLIFDHCKSSAYRVTIPTAEIWAGNIPGGHDMVTDDHAQSVADRMSRASERAQLLTLMGELSEPQRECVTLRFFTGLSVTETAEVMHREEGAVKALQHRAVRRLAELVTPGMFR